MKQLKNKRAARSWQKKKKRAKFSLKLNFHRDKSKNKRRKAISKRAVVLLAGVLLLLAFLYVVIFSAALRIKTVRTIGNENIAAGKLEDVARNEMAGKTYGFIPRDNYLFVDKKKIKSKLAENFSEIENVEVGLKFPNEIILNVKEKNMALIWCRNQCYFVNDKGAAFLLADEGELIREQKHFIKIMEEAQIAEETAAERTAMQKEVGENATAKQKDAKEGENGNASAGGAGGVAQEGASVLSAIALNEQVADEGFIRFAVELSGLVSQNSKLKIKYFKTKGYQSRELIGFTDKNTKLYFDTTKSAAKQAKNLDYLLNEAIDESKIDTLQYIYLKNEDRVFYK